MADGVDGPGLTDLHLGMQKSDLAHIANAMDYLVGGLNNHACNFRMALELGLSRVAAGNSVATIVADCVSGLVVEKETAVTPEEVLRNLRVGFDDGASGPNARFQQSEAYRVVLETMLADLNAMLVQADRITSFTWKEGTFTYPLFWGAGYVFEIGTEAVVIIGTVND